MNFFELQTVLLEMELILNSRPLHYYLFIYFIIYF